MEMEQLTLEQLYAELARREAEPPAVRYRWECGRCGNEHLAGSRMNTVYLWGEVLYCGICVPPATGRRWVSGWIRLAEPMRRRVAYCD
ncbi:hypothetical protein OL229_05285 [Neisseriaceae bacterium JH1-16]|nr:hypothetical protein [Neisseriaceae bacterium JH1-16]